jgi:hypothetical protein
MATILDLFNNKEKELYGSNGYTYIETRGLIDTPRELALLASSPDAVADAIGSTVAGLIGGSAKRPTDTIFGSKQPFSKPVSLLAQTNTLLKYAADGHDQSGEEAYVKMHPQPAILGTLAALNTTFNSQGAAQSAAINILNKYGGKNTAKGWLDGLKANANRGQGYGKKYSTDRTGKTIKENRTYSTHYYDGNEYVERKDTKSVAGKSSWEQINRSILRSATTPEETAGKTLESLQEQNQYINTPYVLFKIYGKENVKNSNIILPGTISGLSEDSAPVISTFKYVGSPFNLYRYGGVERSLKFNLKMYFTTPDEKISMKRNLDKLRALVFPDEKITAIKYADENYTPLAFNPNIAKLTINGLYSDLFVILDSLSISVDDNIPWVSMSDTTEKDNIQRPHPSAFDVSLSMKIIEHPAVKEVDGSQQFIYDKSSDDKNQYINYFTGLDEYQTNYNEMNNSKKIQSYITTGY